LYIGLNPDFDSNISLYYCITRSDAYQSDLLQGLASISFNRFP